MNAEHALLLKNTMRGKYLFITLEASGELSDFLTGNGKSPRLDTNIVPETAVAGPSSHQ